MHAVSLNGTRTGERGRFRAKPGHEAVSNRLLARLSVNMVRILLTAAAGSSFGSALPAGPQSPAGVLCGGRDIRVEDRQVAARDAWPGRGAGRRRASAPRRWRSSPQTVPPMLTVSGIVRSSTGRKRISSTSRRMRSATRLASCLGGADQERAELLAADAAQHVAAAHAALDGAGDQQQRVVAGQVAETVVDPS